MLSFVPLDFGGLELARQRAKRIRTSRQENMAALSNETHALRPSDGPAMLSTQQGDCEAGVLS